MDDLDPAPRSSRRRFLAGSAIGLVAGAAGARAVGSGRRADVASVRRGAERLAAPDRSGWVPEVVGESVEGRPIHLWSAVSSNASPTGRFRLLVVAAIHGDERGVGPIADAIVRERLPPHVDGHLVPIANPDGWMRGTRNNANDVDLNRNFPWWWKPDTGGAGPASEPETRTVMRVVEATRPHLAVFVHQPLRYVATISPTVGPYARAWATASGVPFVSGISQHGGAESWTHYRAGFPSILVEAPTRAAEQHVVDAQLAGFRALIAAI